MRWLKVSFLFLLVLAASAARAASDRRVILTTIDGAIMPPTRAYVERALQRAERENAECLLIEVNTPGGALPATREICGLFLRSRVPIVLYVTPSGAQAASAGAILGLAAHVVAMSPGTNIGAAHPVSGGGGDIGGDMREKVTNDTAAFARTLAEARGRSRQWASDVILKSISNTESEALKSSVIDLVAPSRADLLKQLDGRQVKTQSETRTLHTAGAAVEQENQTWGEGLLNFLFNPNVAIVLFALAIFGLIAELNTPGATFPGVAGAICLVLALYASSALSVNATGAILLLLSVAIFIIDIYATAHGVLTVGGLIAFAVGSLLLFDPGVVGIPISVPLVITLTICTALFFGLIVAAAVKSRSLPPGTGPETLVGMTGQARSDHNPNGRVFIDGALWDSTNVGTDPVHRGDLVLVQSLDGLTLKVKRAQPSPGEPIWSGQDYEPEHDPTFNDPAS